MQTQSDYSNVALFYMLQIGEEEILFVDLDQNTDHCQNLIKFCYLCQGGLSAIIL